MAKDDRFVFLAEWYDDQASLIRKYNLTYYPSDHTIDMVPATIASNSQYSTI